MLGWGGRFDLPEVYLGCVESGTLSSLELAFPLTGGDSGTCSTSCNSWGSAETLCVLCIRFKQRQIINFTATSTGVKPVFLVCPATSPETNCLVKIWELVAFHLQQPSACVDSGLNPAAVCGGRGLLGRAALWPREGSSLSVCVFVGLSLLLEMRLYPVNISDRSSLTCPHCQKQSNTFDPFLCISLPIPLPHTRYVPICTIKLNSLPQPVVASNLNAEERDASGTGSSTEGTPPLPKQQRGVRGGTDLHVWMHVCRLQEILKFVIFSYFKMQ